MRKVRVFQSVQASPAALFPPIMVLMCCSCCAFTALQKGVLHWPCLAPPQGALSDQHVVQLQSLLELRFGKQEPFVFAPCFPRSGSHFRRKVAGPSAETHRRSEHRKGSIPRLGGDPLPVDVKTLPVAAVGNDSGFLRIDAQAVLPKNDLQLIDGRLQVEGVFPPKVCIIHKAPPVVRGRWQTAVVPLSVQGLRACDCLLEALRHSG